MVFFMGFVINVGFFFVLVFKGCLIFFDEFNYVLICIGVCFFGVVICLFKYNDIGDFEVKFCEVIF